MPDLSGDPEGDDGPINRATTLYAPIIRIAERITRQRQSRAAKEVRGARKDQGARMRETGITGSAIIPNCVRFWFKGKSKPIDADCAFGWDKSNGYYRSVDMFLNKFFYKLGICFSVYENLAVFSCNIFTCIVFLKFCVGNSFHIFSPLLLRSVPDRW